MCVVVCVCCAAAAVCRDQRGISNDADGGTSTGCVFGGLPIGIHSRTQPSLALCPETLPPDGTGPGAVTNSVHSFVPSAFTGGRSPLPLSERGRDLLRLCRRDSAHLQPRRPQLRLLAAAAARTRRHRRRRRCCSVQVRRQGASL